MCPKKGLPWGLEVRRKRINLERRTLDGWDVGGNIKDFGRKSRKLCWWGLSWNDAALGWAELAERAVCFRLNHYI